MHDNTPSRLPTPHLTNDLQDAQPLTSSRGSFLGVGEVSPPGSKGLYRIAIEGIVAGRSNQKEFRDL